MRQVLAILGLLLGGLCVPSAARASLSERALAALITPPLQLGTHDPSLPIWTLLDGGGAMIGYVFETRDLAPLPGFSGSPINMLVTMDKSGTFLGVKVLDQNEPVFVDGLGPGPMNEFVRQYAGKSVASNIKVGNSHESGERRESANTYVDGVTKATASTRIMNETILAAALRVARERLAGVAPRTAARPRRNLRQVMDWAGLVRAGMMGHLHLTNRQAEAAFAGTKLASLTSGADPDGLFIDLWFADIGVPTIADALLDAEGRRRVAEHVDSYEEPVLVLANGSASITGENFVRNSVPDLLSARQQGFPVNLRDADVEAEFAPGVPKFDQSLVLRIDTRLGFDPSAPWSLALRVSRDLGVLDPAPAAHDFPVEYRLPAKWFEAPVERQDRPVWMAAWADRAPELAALAALLAGLAVVLARPARLVAPPRRLMAFRLGFLAVTLGVVGWYGQGQLSIVNLLAVEKAALAGGNLAFMLQDPVTVLLGLFTLGALAAWGRGTFCGWLCPFGALQELLSWPARALGLPERRVPWRWHRRLLRVKYAVLAVLLVAAPLSPALADRLVEVEPFKTAITLIFVRHWPFVLYAAAVLLPSLVVYKAYCRYLCPLGAGLALLGRLGRSGWIARRAECGTPCQLCAVRCRYQAIDRAGRIDYAECFQCLDCVAIHDDRATCVPLVLADKRARLPASQAVAQEDCHAPQP